MPGAAAQIQPQLVQVPLLGLKGGLNLRFAVYITPGRDRTPVLFAEAGSTLDAGRLERLRSSGLKSFLVPRSQLPLFYLNLEENLERTLGDAQVPLEERCLYLHVLAQNAAESLLKQRPDAIRIERATRLVESTVRLATTEGQSLAVLRRQIQGSQTLAEHALNSAIYALGLGLTRLGPDLPAVGRLVLAAFLHDVGRAPAGPDEKARPPGTSLALPEGAAPDFDHTQAGAALLQELRQPEEAVAAAAQHHERDDGSGAPAGLAGDEIHPAAQAVALVNVFDHIRTQHQGFLGVYETFQILLHSFSGCFAQELLKAFLASFAGSRA